MTLAGSPLSRGPKLKRAPLPRENHKEVGCGQGRVVIVYCKNFYNGCVERGGRIGGGCVPGVTSPKKSSTCPLYLTFGNEFQAIQLVQKKSSTIEPKNVSFSWSLPLHIYIPPPFVPFYHLTTIYKIPKCSVAVATVTLSRKVVERRRWYHGGGYYNISFFPSNVIIQSTLEAEPL